MMLMLMMAVELLPSKASDVLQYYRERPDMIPVYQLVVTVQFKEHLARAMTGKVHHLKLSENLIYFISR